MAKGRLAPLKSKVTIPRLELLAAVAGKRMAEFCVKEMEVKFSEIYCWSDSKCVLSWILLTGAEKLPKFVKRRIEDIRENASIQWKYVPTKLNPADLASRGCTCNELKANELWWKGPNYLKLKKKEWPQAPELVKNDKEWEIVEEEDEVKMEFCVENLVDEKMSHEWPKLVHWKIKFSVTHTFCQH
jgi:hypothetical protein